LLVIRGGSELRRSNTLLQTELADGLPPVAGDRIQLQQVMLNLILNAVEAMSESSEIRRELLIRTDRDNTGVWSSRSGFRPQPEDRKLGSSLRRLLHDQAQWHGYGTVDLPFDH